MSSATDLPIKRQLNLQNLLMVFSLAKKEPKRISNTVGSGGLGNRAGKRVEEQK